MVLLGIAVVSHFGALPVTIGFVYPLVAIVAFIAGALAPLPLFPAGLHARRAGAIVLAEGVLVASKAGLPGISTTYVTGTLITAMTRGLSHGASGEHRRDAARNLWVIVAYVGGASLGALLFLAFNRNVLILPTLASPASPSGSTAGPSTLSGQPRRL